MNNAKEKFLRGLVSSFAEKEILDEDSLIEIQMIFEKYKGRSNDGMWSEQVIAFEFSEQDIQFVKDAMVSYLNDSPATSDHIGSVIFVLGKLHDKSLIPLIDKKLMYYLDANPWAVAQSIVLLSDLGVLHEYKEGMEWSFHSEDHEQNRKLALEYLMRRSNNTGT